MRFRRYACRRRQLDSRCVALINARQSLTVSSVADVIETSRPRLPQSRMKSAYFTLNLMEKCADFSARSGNYGLDSGPA